MKKFLILSFLIFSVITLVSNKPAYAGEFDKLNLSVQLINPGDFYYPAVRLWEKIVDKFQFKTDTKFKYSISLIDKRMSELGFVVKNKRLGEIQRSSERLSYQVGMLTNYLIKQEDKQMVDQFKLKIDSYYPALSELRDNFPANSSFWMLVQHDINSLKIYSEKLGR